MKLCTGSLEGGQAGLKLGQKREELLQQGETRFRRQSGIRIRWSEEETDRIND